MRFDQIVPLEEFQEKDYFVVPVAKDWEKWPAGLYDFYKDPVSQSAPHAHRQAGVLLREPGQGLPQRRRTSGLPAVDREGHHPRRAHVQQAGAGVPAPGPLQPRPLACPRPGGRYPLEQGSTYRQGEGLRRLSLRAGLDQPHRRRGQRESRTATSSACTTSAAACCAAPWCSSGSCKARSPSITAPGPTTSSPANWIVVAPSTPSRRKGSRREHAAGQATTASWSKSSGSACSRWTMAQGLSDAFERDYDYASGLHFNGWVQEGR